VKPAGRQAPTRLATPGAAPDGGAADRVVPDRVTPDHFVVAARSLDDGIAWCEATLGVAPSAGGRHAMMGTHNVLLGLGSPRFPRTYLEIVAIDAAAASPSRPRWFDLDQPQLQRAIESGPRLVHWVARAGDLEATSAVWRAGGEDPGVVTPAERMSPRGLLRWRITLRADGGRPCGGAVPLLIEWGGEHPGDALPASGVTIEDIRLGGVTTEFAAGVGASAATAGPPSLTLVLATPIGRVVLASPAFAVA